MFLNNQLRIKQKDINLSENDYKHNIIKKTNDEIKLDLKNKTFDLMVLNYYITLIICLLISQNIAFAQNGFASCNIYPGGTNGLAPLEISFTCQASTNGVVFIDMVYIAFGDGEQGSGYTTSFNVKHTYTKPGVYTVTGLWRGHYNDFGDKINVQCSKSYKDLVTISVSGLEEERLSSNQLFFLYPNPVSDNLIIQIIDNQFQSISICNSFGIEIKRIEENELLGKSSISISTEEFTNGMYYWTLTSKGNRITKSFVVIK